MTERIRNIAVISLIALMLSAATAAARLVSPLPRSDYTVRALCTAPAPGHAGCLSLELAPRTTAAHARTHPIGMTRTAPRASQAAEGVFGLTPEDLHTAYNLPKLSSTTQTIAIVDAYNDPTAAADLEAYSEEFELPACTKANGCFKQVNQNGENAEEGSLPFPRTVAELKEARKGTAKQKEEAAEATGWGVEISLDMETAHAICESCDIVLVEAASSGYTNLETAESTAASLGATEISNSWGGPEAGETQGAESVSPFNHPGIVITASSGDDGYLNWGSETGESGFANFPASSPHVVAVGGTRLELSATTGEWQGESVWNGNGAGGGGCSEVFPSPAWQQAVSTWSSVGCAGLRAVADVSADADPYTGVAVHDSTPGAECEGTLQDPHWCTIGGTSLASPLVAAVFALAGGAGEVAYPARTLYEHELTAPASLHDVTLGSNAECATYSEETGLAECTAQQESENSGCPKKAICLAGVGYDGPTGVGTPSGIKAFEPTGNPEEPKEPETGEGGGGKGGGLGGGKGAGPGGATTGAPAGSTVAPTIPGIPPTLQLSALALTENAIVALNNSHPKVSQIGFTFTVNLGTTVRLTLSKRVHRHHHSRWKTLGHAVTGSAVSGRNLWRLKGHGRLSPGRYRITLTPPHAASKSLTFLIG